MSGEKFRLVLSGNLVDGFDRNDVEEKLARLMRLPLKHVHTLLQGKISKIPRELNFEKAERLCKKLNACGAESRIEPVIRKTADKQEADNPIRAEEDILQPTSDEAEIVDSLDLDLLDANMPTPQGAQSIVIESDPREWNVFSDAADEEEEGGSGQVFEQPNRVQGQDWKSIGSLLLSNKKFILMLGGLSLMILLVLFYFFISDSGNNAAGVRKQPEVQNRNKAPADPELALTQEHAEGLSRQVRVWMVQYGSGDPMLVTLDRLKQDLEISAKEMVDGWGTPLRYEPAERSYVIRSAGPDKSFETKDDLVKKAEMY